MMAVQFHFLAKASLKDRRWLKTYISNIFKSHSFNLKSLQIIFCSDEYLLQINRQHLQHDYYTDIITFDLSEEQGTVIAELYISIDRVLDNASLQKTHPEKELHRVIFHGCLHLCGFKDKSPSDIKTIRKQEDLLLVEYFNVPRGTS